MATFQSAVSSIPPSGGQVLSKNLSKEDSPHHSPPTKAERRARAVKIKAEAEKSPLDRYGNVRCLSCGKVLGSYEGLAGHLISLHGGENSEERRVVEAGQVSNWGGGGSRPPVLLSEGMAPVLKMLPGGRGRAAWGKESHQGGNDLGKSVLQGGVGQRGGKQEQKENRLGDEEGGRGARTRVSLLAGHAAVAVSGEGHKVNGPQKEGGEKKVLNPNTAQSSGMVERRGKEREQPKKHRLSKLKKLVLKERGEVAEALLSGEPEIVRGKESRDCEKGLGGSLDCDRGKPLVQEAEAIGSHSGDESTGKVDCGGEGESEREGNGDLGSGGLSEGQCLEDPGQSSSHDLSTAGGETTLQKEKQEPTTYIGPNVKIRYCPQVISQDLNATCFELLKELVRFQERVRAQDPAKLKMKRRLVTGFREVAKSVKTQRAKCIIVAPNIEETIENGVLDTSLAAILDSARGLGVNVVFALTRLQIAQAFGRRTRMSIVAILSFEGADELYKKMLAQAIDGRREWEEIHGATH